MNIKTIILFRHGESDWNFDFDKDHERSLTKKGIKATEKMGAYLLKINQIPDIVVSSTALRAKTTAEVAIKKGQWNCPLLLESGIYGGNPQFLFNLVKLQDNIFNSICLVGHEPNFSRFISLATDGEYISFPTSSMAKIDFNVKNWVEIIMGFGNLDWLVGPKDC